MKNIATPHGQRRGALAGKFAFVLISSLAIAVGVVAIHPPSAEAAKARTKIKAPAKKHMLRKTRLLTGLVLPALLAGAPFSAALADSQQLASESFGRSSAGIQKVEIRAAQLHRAASGNFVLPTDQVMLTVEGAWPASAVKNHKPDIKVVPSTLGRAGTIVLEFPTLDHPVAPLPNGKHVGRDPVFTSYTATLKDVAPGRYSVSAKGGGLGELTPYSSISVKPAQPPSSYVDALQ